jgi:AraC-like DNA-binding protein
LLITSAPETDAVTFRIGQTVDRWQVLAGDVSLGLAPRDLVRRARKLAEELPSAMTAVELVVVQRVTAQVLSGIARSLGALNRQEFSGPFMTWTNSTPIWKGWKTDLIRLLDQWRDILDKSCDAGVPNESRLARAIEFLDIRFSDPALSLADLARVLQVSSCHASRLLQRETGRGFKAHVHSRRVTRAQELLRTTLDSIKEVAFEVGFASGSQLGRHFKRLAGMTPCEYRHLSRAKTRDE